MKAKILCFNWQLKKLRNFQGAKISPQDGGTRYFYYTFTEQGIYMLMTVLKDDIAVRQNRALVRTFKQKKDYIVENQEMYNKLTCVKLTSSFIWTYKAYIRKHVI